MTTEEYLKQTYRLDEKINCDIAEAEQLRTLASGISIPSFGNKVQTSPSSSAPFMSRLEMLIDLEKEIDREIDLYVELKKQVRAVISAVADSNERLVLQYRYILNQTWDQISAELDVDERTIRRWHIKALSHVVMPQNPIKI